jgi:REP element-mobilizing transposase RayT
MDKFQNKYRIPSTRLQNWDYRWPGAYFITICTKNREHYFGEISDGTMQLSGTGILADVFWHEIKNHGKNVELGEYVTMPNHIHGILILNGDDDGGDGIDNGNDNGDGDCGGGGGDGHAVETGHALSLRRQQPPQSDERKTIGQQRFQNIGKNSVSAIIGSYKSAVTKHAHRLGFTMEWQERFHDHIIRDNAEYQRIAEYIRNNPLNWEIDKFYNNT